MTPPIIVILGPTASGKSALALQLAQQYGGEIICADSRTVYKYMDIGTAKPTMQEQALVRHHLLDVVEPDESFSAADFKRLAQKAIGEIVGRGNVPIIAGGTGLYIDALVYDYEFGLPADPDVRAELSAMTLDELHTRLLELDIPIPCNENNPRHIIRAIELAGKRPQRTALRANTLLIGIQVPLDELTERIRLRVDAMVAAGFEDETRQLFARYPTDVEALRAPGYRAFRDYLVGHIDLGEAKTMFVKADRALARRQMTWFRRNHSIQWVTNPSMAVEIATTFLNKN